MNSAGVSLLSGFAPLRMAGPNDCGPTAALSALRQAGLAFSREQLIEAWGFREGADKLDTPGHHLRTLRALGVRASMRRRLGLREANGALSEGKALVILVPTGLARWHWVVVCGCGPGEDGVVVSAGDGLLRTARWGELARRWTRHAASRLLRVDGLGYVLGRTRAFARDRALERDMLRLAALAEGLPGFLENAAKAALALVARGRREGSAGLFGEPLGGRP